MTLLVFSPTPVAITSSSTEQIVALSGMRVSRTIYRSRLLKWFLCEVINAGNPIPRGL